MNKIWLSSPHLTGEEQKYVKEAFDTNWVAPLGPNVNGLEQDICKFTGSEGLLGTEFGIGSDTFSTDHARHRTK